MPGFFAEFSTQDDIEKFRHDIIELCLQSLWIRERTLLKFNNIHQLASFEIYSVLLRFGPLSLLPNTNNSQNHQRDIQDRLEILWQYALGIQLKFSKPIDEKLMMNLFEFAVYLNYTNEYTTLKPQLAVKVIKMCVHEINRIAQALKRSSFLDWARLFDSNREFKPRGIDFDDLFELNDSDLVAVECRHDEFQYDCFQVDKALSSLLKIATYCIRFITKCNGINRLATPLQCQLKILTKNLLYFSNIFKFDETMLAMTLKSNLAK